MTPPTEQPRYKAHENNGGFGIIDKWLGDKLVWFERGRKARERAEKEARRLNGLLEMGRT